VTALKERLFIEGIDNSHDAITQDRKQRQGVPKPARWFWTTCSALK
jgi:hypothetical protein